jgi:hypothetical protein
MHEPYHGSKNVEVACTGASGTVLAAGGANTYHEIVGMLVQVNATAAGGTVQIKHGSTVIHTILCDAVHWYFLPIYALIPANTDIAFATATSGAARVMLLYNTIDQEK